MHEVECDGYWRGGGRVHKEGAGMHGEVVGGSVGTREMEYGIDGCWRVDGGE